MAFYMHVGHYKPQGTFKSVKYDPLNVHAQCVRCNKWLHGNLAAYSLALETHYKLDFVNRLNQEADDSEANIAREEATPEYQALTGQKKYEADREKNDAKKIVHSKRDEAKREAENVAGGEQARERGTLALRGSYSIFSSLLRFFSRWLDCWRWNGGI